MKSAWMVIAITMTLTMGCQDKTSDKAPSPSPQGAAPEAQATNPAPPAATPEKGAKAPSTEKKAEAPVEAPKGPSLGDQANALADQVCACKDLECAKALMEKGKALEAATAKASDDDKTAVKTARTRADTCSQRLLPKNAPLIKPPPSPGTELEEPKEETGKEPAPGTAKLAPVQLQEPTKGKAGPSSGAPGEPTCAQVFAKTVALCKATPACAAKALKQLADNQDRYLKECAAKTTIGMRKCALQAKELGDMRKCASR